MNVSTIWHGDQFNVELSSKEGAEAFLSVKGCRIANGQNGPFVSWPATKNANSGKWWSHVWGSEKFSAVVLEKAIASQPAQGGKSRSRGGEDLSDVPF